MGAYLEDKDLEQAEKIVGGRFKLTALLQRRVQEIIRTTDRTQNPLGDRNPIETALREILDGKIELVEDEEHAGFEGPLVILPEIADKPVTLPLPVTPAPIDDEP